MRRVFALAAAALLFAGCATTDEEALVFDGAHPCVSVTSLGIKFGKRLVTPQEVPELLEKHQIAHDRTIHILLEDPNADQRMLWVFQHNVLGRAGYRRTVLVTPRKAESTSKEMEKRR